MVELINIKLNGNVISCDYIPEQSGMEGTVFVDTKSEEISKVNYSEYEYGKKMYVAHVRSKLIELFLAGNPIPNSATSIWF